MTSNTNMKDLIISLIWPEGEDLSTGPESFPRIKAEGAVAEQALAEWFTSHGGAYVIKNNARSLQEKIIRALNHPRKTEDERVENLFLLEEIKHDIAFTQTIMYCIAAQEAKKKKA